MNHPAKFNDAILDVIGRYLDNGDLVLDPFAGVGRIHRFYPRCETYGIEIEPEWAQEGYRTLVGDCTDLWMFEDGIFDKIATSPCFGNRMGDHHNAQDACKKCQGDGGWYQRFSRDDDWEYATCSSCKGSGLSRRHTYRAYLGHMPSDNSSAIMQWGPEYRRWHFRKAYPSIISKLKSGGLFVINIGDHYRKGERQQVAKWTYKALRKLGLEHVKTHRVHVRKNRHGANRELRVPYEYVMVFRKP